jgi:hypothetical protein
MPALPVCCIGFKSESLEVLLHFDPVVAGRR